MGLLRSWAAPLPRGVERIWRRGKQFQEAHQLGLGPARLVFEVSDLTLVIWAAPASSFSVIWYSLGVWTLRAFHTYSTINGLKWSESRLVVSDSVRPHGLYSPWNSLGQNTGVGSPSLLQGTFPTKGSNPGLLCCRRILYQLSHRGSPINGLTGG